MGAKKLARLAWTALSLAAFSTGLAGAVCLDTGGFAIFQCADLAYFAPPPVPVTFDAGGRPTNMSVVFWQIGFGNQKLNTGSGTRGTGNSGPFTFNGNDQGILGVNIRNARIATGNPNVPTGATCISTANWGDFGVDGCSDNARATELTMADDGILNGYFNWYYQYNYQPGEYSLNWQQDYPMAVLMKAPAQVHTCNTTTAACDILDQVCTAGPRAGLACAVELDCDFCADGPKVNDKCRFDHQCSDDGAAQWVSFAAVATLNRGNTGGSGPCAATPGANVAPCDIRPGYYNLSDVTNGTPNPSVVENNVVPWQTVPFPYVSGSMPDPNGAPTLLLDLHWTGLTVYSDQSVRPTTNPGMGGSGCVSPGCCTGESCAGVSDPTRAPGVGVLDIASKFGGLVRYKVEVASESDPGFAAPLFSQETFGTTMGAVPVPSTNGCYRITTLFGKRPETLATSEADCRLGKCGDIGYEAASRTICLSSGCLPAGPEVCDGVDNDCNGTIDDGDPGSGGSCSTGQAGVCSAGTFHCQGGTLACVQNLNPSAEICDNLDNDCDGSVDGMATSCGVGPCAATGSCVSGIDSCMPRPPAAESCNNVDDDCDGVVDDGDPDGGGSCSTGQPGVCSAGTFHCQGGTLACVRNTSPSAEICDNLDNDCDGSVDGMATSCGLGPCAATGDCVAGVDTCVAGTPVTETCNNIDDDCDGAVDDVPGQRTICGTTGACARTGHTTCVAGVPGDTCVPGTPSPETCNNIDDDCDGMVDEGNPGGGASCSTGRPGVCSAGTITCQSGSLRCVQNTPATSFDVCGDGLDNDCDGLTDAQDPDCAPLVVSLASFEARAGSRGITITWSTATEIDNAGFMLLRGESASGPFTPLMNALIPGRGSAVSGAAYTYEDRAVRRKKMFYYVLVDVDLNGTETRHGPVSASIGAPKPDRRGR